MGANLERFSLAVDAPTTSSCMNAAVNLLLAHEDKTYSGRNDRIAQYSLGRPKER